MTQEEILQARKELAEEEMAEAHQRAERLRAHYDDLQQRSNNAWLDWTAANDESWRMYKQWHAASDHCLYYPRYAQRPVRNLLLPMCINR